MFLQTHKGVEPGKGNAVSFVATVLHKRGNRHQDIGHHFNKTVVTWQAGKVCQPVFLNRPLVEPFECPVAGNVITKTTRVMISLSQTERTLTLVGVFSSPSNRAFSGRG